MTIKDGNTPIVLETNKVNIEPKQGDIVTIRIGNTVIDVMHGGKEKAHLDAYPYDESKPYAFVVNDDKQVGVYVKEE
jgi:hypothetical protein